jgi:hypothetical protein
VVLLGAIVANLALTIALRNRRAAFWFAFSAFILVTATLAIFLVWTYPANQATNNWTVVPGNWQQLRTQWEYSHAANALLTFAAFCSVVVAALRSKAQTPALASEAVTRNLSRATTGGDFDEPQGSSASRNSLLNRHRPGKRRRVCSGLCAAQNAARSRRTSAIRIKIEH